MRHQHGVVARPPGAVRVSEVSCRAASRGSGVSAVRPGGGRAPRGGVAVSGRGSGTAVSHRRPRSAAPHSAAGLVSRRPRHGGGGGTAPLWGSRAPTPGSLPRAGTRECPRLCHGGWTRAHRGLRGDTYLCLAHAACRGQYLAAGACSAPHSSPSRFFSVFSFLAVPADCDKKLAKPGSHRGHSALGKCSSVCWLAAAGR